MRANIRRNPEKKARLAPEATAGRAAQAGHRPRRLTPPRRPRGCACAAGAPLAHARAALAQAPRPGSLSLARAAGGCARRLAVARTPRFRVPGVWLPPPGAAWRMPALAASPRRLSAPRLAGRLGPAEPRKRRPGARGFCALSRGTRRPRRGSAPRPPRPRAAFTPSTSFVRLFLTQLGQADLCASPSPSPFWLCARALPQPKQKTGGQPTAICKTGSELYAPPPRSAGPPRLLGGARGKHFFIALLRLFC